MNNERTDKTFGDYLWLTNMESPVDKVDGNFLNVLTHYRIGPPQPTPEKSAQEMVSEGIFGVYTTVDAISHPQVVKLSGFRVSALSKVKLG